jgi:putative transposase
MIAICRDHAANARALAGRADGAALDRRRDGRGAKQFRRINGPLHLPALRAALDATIATVTPSKEDAAA